MMEMALMLAVTILAFAATQSLTEAFLTPQNHARKMMKSTGPLFVGPTYDKTTEKWSPSSDEEGPEAGYGIGKTFLLHGPEPTFQRLFRADNYEQAVLTGTWASIVFVIGGRLIYAVSHGMNFWDF